MAERGKMKICELSENRNYYLYPGTPGLDWITIRLLSHHLLSDNKIKLKYAIPGESKFYEKEFNIDFLRTWVVNHKNYYGYDYLSAEIHKMWIDISHEIRTLPEFIKLKFIDSKSDKIIFFGNHGWMGDKTMELKRDNLKLILPYSLLHNFSFRLDNMQSNNSFHFELLSIFMDVKYE